MQEKPKIAFVVSSELFVRNYFKTDALAQLERDWDVHFVVSADIKDRDTIEGNGRKIVYYPVDHRHRKRQFKTYKVLMRRYQKRSSTFEFRLDRMFEPKRKYTRPLLANLTSNLNALRERIGIAARRARLGLLASGPVFHWIRRKRIVMLEPSQGIVQALSNTAFNLIVMPSSAFDPDGNDVIQHAKRAGIKTMFLIDNWDNLSSKSVMLLKPDFLGVWGDQSALHAKDIQDFDVAKVCVLGTPRFDEYFRARDEKISSPFDFPYILFLGTSLSFDEASALEHLEAVINRNPDRFNGVRIIYRPHPWRSDKDTIVGRGLQRVDVDPQLADHYFGTGRRTHFQPELTYYPGLLMNAELVVGGLTSMMIEATIFGKDYVALTYDDGINITNQRTVFERSEHFRGIEQIPSIGLCKVKADAERLLLDAWDRRGERDRSQIDVARQYILFDDGRPYSERLAALANEAAR
ncbi:MAG: hypothetical protein AAGF88_11025 [Pseudomonadota bacterium]